MKMQFSGFLISGLRIQCNMPENSNIVQLQDCYIEWKENYFIYWHLRVCPWENQAGADTAQVTDFAQTWHKCWFWRVNDYGKNLG